MARDRIFCPPTCFAQIIGSSTSCRAGIAHHSTFFVQSHSDPAERPFRHQEFAHRFRHRLVNSAVGIRQTAMEVNRNFIRFISARSRAPFPFAYRWNASDLASVTRQPFSFAAICATCRPWNRAWASSFSLGCREPSAPAIVAAPHGEPPFTSLMSASSGQVYGKPT